MAKYSPNVELIKGAGVAYKNWENVPGMYKGLEDLSKTGEKMVETAMTKLDKDKKEDELIRAKFDKIATKVYEQAGSLGKDDYTHAVAYMEELEQRHYDAWKDKDSEAASAINIEFNEYLAGIESQKNIRKDIAGDPEAGTGLSEAVKGDNLKIITEWTDGKYTKSTNPETQEWEYTMNVDGIGEITKTEAEIKKMATQKDPIPNAAFVDQFDKIMQKGNWDKNTDLLKYNIRTKVLPQTADGLNAYLNDEGFGLDSDNFAGLMEFNMEKIKNELDTSTTSYFDTDKTTPGIDIDEYKNFVDAIVNPNHEFWGGDTKKWQKFAGDIATDALANITENGWYELHEPSEEVEETSTKQGPLN